MRDRITSQQSGQVARPESTRVSHGSVLPADVFQGGNFTVTLRNASTAAPPEKVKLWHVSPFGIEVLKSQGQELQMGSLIEVDLKAGTQELHYVGQVTGLEDMGVKGLLVGLRFHREARTFTEETRKAVRWNCDPIYSPTGSATNQLRFNDTVYFHVKNISSDGMLMITSLRNKHFLAGTQLDALMTFPCVGQAPMRFSVNHVREVSLDSKPFLAVGISFQRADERAKSLLGQYLLQFGSLEGKAPSISELRSQGFFVQSSAKAIDFSYVRTQEEYEEALALRDKAFSATLAIKVKTELATWSDLFDSRAKIVIGRHRGHVVASARIVFPDKDEELEHEKFADLSNILPPRNEIVEVGRICTDPDYRGNDILIALFRFVLLTIHNSGRRYLLSNCTDDLLPLYKRTGSFPSGISFVHKNDKKRHHILLGDIHKIVSGSSLGLINWSVMVKPFWPMVSEVVEANATAIEKLRLRAYRMMGAGLNVLLALKEKKTKKRSRKRPQTASQQRNSAATSLKKGEDRQ